jgi:hypothetical protein
MREGVVLKRWRRAMMGKLSRRWLGSLLTLGLVLAVAESHAASPRPATCAKIVLAGEVNAGQEWRAAFGQGWVFRVLPIQPGKAGYSGWDLVVDREQPAGYPDALLLATPPYNSINEREIGTTYGLRAQDAIGWNPRSFRFLTHPAGFEESRKLYLLLSRGGQVRLAVPEASGQKTDAARATRRLMELDAQSSAGQFHILDAHLAPGISDAKPYAENWALRSVRTPHANRPAQGGNATPLGALDWMRFSVTLWLPAGWKAPRELHAAPASCSE